jgi:hypothetical protein
MNDNLLLALKILGGILVIGVIVAISFGVYKAVDSGTPSGTAGLTEPSEAPWTETCEICDGNRQQVECKLTCTASTGTRCSTGANPTGYIKLCNYWDVNSTEYGDFESCSISGKRKGYAPCVCRAPGCKCPGSRPSKEFDCVPIGVWDGDWSINYSTGPSCTKPQNNPNAPCVCRLYGTQKCLPDLRKFPTVTASVLASWAEKLDTAPPISKTWVCPGKPPSEYLYVKDPTLFANAKKLNDIIIAQSAIPTPIPIPIPPIPTPPTPSPEPIPTPPTPSPEPIPTPPIPTPPIPTPPIPSL